MVVDELMMMVVLVDKILVVVDSRIELSPTQLNTNYWMPLHCTNTYERIVIEAIFSYKDI
jgi:hypothetical protein